jgi:hypothetical protein
MHFLHYGVSKLSTLFTLLSLIVLCCCNMVVDNGVLEAPRAGATPSIMSSEMAMSPSLAIDSSYALFLYVFCLW